MPRSIYSNKTRYGSLGRIRYASVMLEWMTAQATRLSTTKAVIYKMLALGLPPRRLETVAGTIPINTVAPAITGTAQSGQTLTTTNGTWTGLATITYSREWRANGVPIAGATALTYVVVVGDVGKTISCMVTATNSLASSSLSSAATATVI